MSGVREAAAGGCDGLRAARSLANPSTNVLLQDLARQPRRTSAQEI